MDDLFFVICVMLPLSVLLITVLINLPNYTEFNQWRSVCQATNNTVVLGSDNKYVCNDKNNQKVEVPGYGDYVKEY